MRESLWGWTGTRWSSTRNVRRGPFGAEGLPDWSGPNRHQVGGEPGATHARGWESRMTARRLAAALAVLATTGPMGVGCGATGSGAGGGQANAGGSAGTSTGGFGGSEGKHVMSDGTTMSDDQMDGMD